MLNSLGKQFIVKKDEKESGSHFIITLLKKATSYGISYDLMKRLNYHDLLALVIEYDIENVREHLRMLQKQKNERLNREVKIASNEDILKMHNTRRM